MPGVNGLEVCRFIKRDPVSRSTPVVFISAEDDPSVMKEAKEAGASGYMIKPVDFDSLEDVLEKTSKITKDSAPDGGKAKDSALDGGKMKGSGPDTSKAKNSAPDIGKSKDSTHDTGKTKDSAHDTGKL